jgi:hypothetical protein
MADFDTTLVVSRRKVLIRLWTPDGTGYSCGLWEVRVEYILRIDKTNSLRSWDIQVTSKRCVDY